MTLLRYALAALVACALTAGAYAASPPKPNPGPHSSAAAASTAIAVSGAAARAKASQKNEQTVNNPASPRQAAPVYGGAPGLAVSAMPANGDMSCQRGKTEATTVGIGGSMLTGGGLFSAGRATGETTDIVTCFALHAAQQARLNNDRDTARKAYCLSPFLRPLAEASGTSCAFMDPKPAQAESIAPVSLAPASPNSDYCARNPSDFYCRK